MLERDAGIAEISALLGQKNLSTTAPYTHVKGAGATFSAAWQAN